MILLYRAIISILFLSISLFALEAYNGECIAIKTQKDTKVKFLGKTIPSLKFKKGYFALLPMPYKIKQKYLYATVINHDKKRTLKIKIIKKRYKKEQIRVNPSKVKPSKKALNRIYKEYKEAKKIYAKITPKRYFKGDFLLPLHSKITSLYGNARIFNGSLRSFHSGTDFRAKISTPIRAVNDGKVVIAKDRYYAGRSVVIDHGEGIYSCYYHLSKIKVKVGEFVKKGEVVGLSGKSGRVSGPHLHFSIYLYGYAINPLEFEKVVNSL